MLPISPIQNIRERISVILNNLEGEKIHSSQKPMEQMMYSKIKESQVNYRQSFENLKLMVIDQDQQ